MLYSFSGQLSVFLWDLAVLLDSLVLMCMFLLLFEQINDWLIDWLIEVFVDAELMKTAYSYSKFLSEDRSHHVVDCSAGASVNLTRDA